MSHRPNRLVVRDHIFKPTGSGSNPDLLFFKELKKNNQKLKNLLLLLACDPFCSQTWRKKLMPLCVILFVPGRGEKN